MGTKRPRHTVFVSFRRWVTGFTAMLCFAGAVACGSSAATSPSPPPGSSAPAVVGVQISGNLSFNGLNQSSQLSAIATLSDGSTRNISSLAVWRSSNTSVASVSGTGMVTSTGYGNAEINATSEGRSGAGEVTVRQPCTIGLASTSRTLGSLAGTDSVTVSTSVPDCVWTAETSTSWISIGTTRGTGTGPLTYSVTAHGGTSQRQGSIAVENQTLTVRQDPPAAPPPPPPPSQCTYSLTSPKTVSFGSGGGSDTARFTPTGAAGCVWTASPSDSWITVIDQAGTGEIVVRFSVGANPGTVRSGRIEVRWGGTQVGENILLSQAGR